MLVSLVCLFLDADMDGNYLCIILKLIDSGAFGHELRSLQIKRNSIKNGKIRILIYCSCLAAALQIDNVLVPISFEYSRYIFSRHSRNA